MSDAPGPGDDPRQQAAHHAGEAILTLLELMRESGSDQVRLAAARELLDRGHGKPRAEQEQGNDGPTLQEMVRASYREEGEP